MTPKRRWTPLLLAVGLVALLWGGCGPIQASQAIGDGRKALETARLAGAEELSPYQYHRATAYLEMAKRKEGFAEFDIAQQYAKTAYEAAQQATTDARKRAKFKALLEQRRTQGR